MVKKEGGSLSPSLWYWSDHRLEVQYCPQLREPYYNWELEQKVIWWRQPWCWAYLWSSVNWSVCVPLQSALEFPFQRLPFALPSVLCEDFSVTEGKRACANSPSSMSSTSPWAYRSVPSSNSSSQGKHKLLRLEQHLLDAGRLSSCLERPGDLGGGCIILGCGFSSGTFLVKKKVSLFWASQLTFLSLCALLSTTNNASAGEWWDSSKILINMFVNDKTEVINRVIHTHRYTALVR